MIRPTLAASLLFTTSALALPAQAQTSDQPVEVHREAEQCWANATIDAATGANITVGFDITGKSWVRASARNWPFKDGAIEHVRFVDAAPILPARYNPNGEAAVEARGFVDSAGLHGIAFPIEPALHLTLMHQKLALHQKNATTPFTTFANPYPGMASPLRNCLWEMARNDRGSGQPVVTKPVPGALSITDDDYPASAIRAEQQGTTRLLITVSAHGVVSDCALVASSGAAVLDSTACRLLQYRARFTPALDANGAPTQSQVTSSITWKIPGYEPKPAPLPQPIRQ